MKKSKRPAKSKRPKGSYPLPDGNYVVRRGQITAIHRNPPDVDKLAKALLWLAQDLEKSDGASTSGDKS